jgi:coenzyme F420-reducing hydrogenase beta subunit
MSKTAIPASWRQQLLAEWNRRCAYCQTTTFITGSRLVIDHIIPEAKGGRTILENLCVACHSCNEYNLTEFADPASLENVLLYHPRKQQWSEHFTWSQDGGEIIGRTAIGRATITALNMNHLEIVEARRRWASVGWHPPS